jgi:hypothetical protein
MIRAKRIKWEKTDLRKVYFLSRISYAGTCGNAIVYIIIKSSSCFAVFPHNSSHLAFTCNTIREAKQWCQSQLDAFVAEIAEEIT